MAGPDHYQKVYRRHLSIKDIANRYVDIKLDPYRMAEILQLGGGAREQIFKKAARWGDKGHSEEKVIKEIIQACERRLEMINEDRIPEV